MTKQYQLPKEFAERWVAALRSGEYKQGFGRYLSKNDCYCSMGVGLVANGHTISGIGNYIDAPEIENKLFFTNSNGAGDLFDALWKLNDMKRLPFPKIADWIEENVEFTESEAQNV